MKSLTRSLLLALALTTGAWVPVQAQTFEMRPELTSAVYGVMLTQCHPGSSGITRASPETVAIAGAWGGC